jgi:hypothetical protein
MVLKIAQQRAPEKKKPGFFHQTCATWFDGKTRLFIHK